MGPVSAECPGEGHSAPFGNWGVTSNVGHKIDGHQFNGWCRNHRYTDNWGESGECRGILGRRSKWYQWNSCTTHARYSPRNCTLYNSNNCTQQVTTQGENNHGTTDSDIWVTCPYDNNDDGYCDTGGCSGISTFSVTNWMTLYELDPASRDDLVQSMYFPKVTVRTTCTVMGCNPITSSWVSPNRYDTPTSPALVKAQAAFKVNSARFIDRYGSCALRAMNDDGYDCK